ARARTDGHAERGGAAAVVEVLHRVLVVPAPRERPGDQCADREAAVVLAVAAVRDRSAGPEEERATGLRRRRLGRGPLRAVPSERDAAGHRVVAAELHRFARDHELCLAAERRTRRQQVALAHDDAVPDRVEAAGVEQAPLAVLVGGRADVGIAAVEVAADVVPRAEPRIDLAGGPEPEAVAVAARAVRVAAAGAQLVADGGAGAGAAGGIL